MAKQQQRQQRDNYFKMQIKRFGVNFLQSKTSKDMQRDCVRIVKDIVHGNIELASEGRYLTDPNLLVNCINVANSKKYYYETIVFALERLSSELQSTGGYNPAIQDIIRINKCNLEVWSISLNAFLYLQMNPDYVGILTTMVNQLSGYRKTFN